MEWKFYKSCYQIEFLAPRMVLPGPLRPLYYLAKSLYHCKKGEGKEEKEKKEEEYRETLTNILKAKMKSERQKLLEQNN